MSYKDYFPSKYLKVDDLKGRKVAATISCCGAEEVGQGPDKTRKLVVRFKETSKGLVMNRVNSDTVSELTGTEDEQEWVGHRIILIPSKTDYQGKRVGCIRIEGPEGGTAPAASSDIFDMEFEDETAAANDEPEPPLAPPASAASRRGRGK
jgi:hypothetical protein